MPYKPKLITVRLTAEQHQAVKDAANAKGCSMNQYCLYMLLDIIPTTSSPEKEEANPGVTNV